MINKLKYALISDIGIFNPTFYDENNEAELKDFCASWGIDYLPGKDRKTIYKLVDGQFQKHEPHPQLIVKPYYRIFDSRTIDGFEAYKPNEIRFIVEEGLIKGVVHIIDYNNEFIQVELYRSMYRFERYLRRFLLKKGKRNRDFIDWVYHRSKTSNSENDRHFWNRRYDALMPSNKDKQTEIILKRRELNPFQTFYLKELMIFAVDNNLLDKKHISIEKINDLRNLIAHSNNPTPFEKRDGVAVFNFDNLKEYVDKVQAFFEAFDYLRRQMEA